MFILHVTKACLPSKQRVQITTADLYCVSNSTFIAQWACMALIKNTYINHTKMFSMPNLHTFSCTARIRGESTMETKTPTQGFTNTYFYQSDKGKYLQERVCVQAQACASCQYSNIHFIFQVVTLSGMQQSKDKQTVDTSPRCITLTRGGLHLAVSFPANSAIRLQDGQLDRVLQREYCECKARSTNRETIKHQ